MPEKITDAEYEEYYKSIAISCDNYLFRKHFEASGDTYFKALFFVPMIAPLLFDDKHTIFRTISLYAQGKLMMEESQEFIHNWLSFFLGVVDSDDISQDTDTTKEPLQYRKILMLIKQNLAKQCIEWIT